MNDLKSLKSTLHTTQKHIDALEKLNILTPKNLLFFFPRDIESFQNTGNFAEIILDKKNTVSGTLHNIRSEKSPRKKKNLAKAAFMLDDGSSLNVIWFTVPYMLKNLREGTHVYLVGRITRDNKGVTVVNPEIHLNKNLHVGALRAVYRETPPLSSKWLREKINLLLPLAKKVSSILPSEIIRENSLLPKSQALREIHSPKNVFSWERARKTLAFEEIFLLLLKSLYQKNLSKTQVKNKFCFSFSAQKIRQQLKKLPFSLTLSQKKVLLEILQDFASSSPAKRLLQGDTGSGKTVVAFLAASEIIRENFQVCLMAPTEILATQHYNKAREFFPKEISVELLTGSVSAKKKLDIKKRLSLGKIDLLLGTHAVLTEDTVFKKLGLLVVDEQHRFGVNQRNILTDKNPHILTMSATPIPRTLAMTIYGDQDISTLTELPPGRQIPLTRVIETAKKRRLCIEFIRDQVRKGKQIFWVCPLIDPSDKVEARNVAEEFEKISREIFPELKVAFLHGKLKNDEKTDIMSEFKNHKFDILVSTSVIEVGIDIPSASSMVIENSDRFGLAQLHQFRGRIGRNSDKSYCFLMVDDSRKKDSLRLAAMERYHEGQILAEIDLKIRGMGNIFGVEQSGIPDFRIASITDFELITTVQSTVKTLLAKDPLLKSHPKLLQKIERLDIKL